MGTHLGEGDSLGPGLWRHREKNEQALQLVNTTLWHLCGLWALASASDIAGLAEGVK